MQSDQIRAATDQARLEDIGIVRAWSCRTTNRAVQSLLQRIINEIRALMTAPPPAASVVTADPPKARIVPPVTIDTVNDLRSIAERVADEADADRLESIAELIEDYMLAREGWPDDPIDTDQD